MKQFLPYIVALVLLPMGLFCQEVSEEFTLTVPENAPPGTFIARAFKTESEESFYLPGIHDITVGGTYYYYIVDKGDLWALPMEEDNQPIKVAGPGVTSVFSNGIYTHFLKEGGVHWVFPESSLDKSRSDKDFHFEPMQTGLKNIQQIFVEKHVLLLSRDGGLWGFANNDYGQLGFPELEEVKQPKRIDDSPVQWIAGTYYFSLYVKQDGSLWGMGNNDFRTLGSKSDETQRTPRQIVPRSVQSAYSGLEHSYYITEDGTLWGMGAKFSTDSYSADQAGKRLENNVASIAAKYGLCLIQKDDGSLWALDMLKDFPYNADGFLNTKVLAKKGVKLIAVAQDGSLFNQLGIFTTADGSLWSTDGKTSKTLLSPSKICLPEDADNHLFTFEGGKIYTKTILNHELKRSHSVYFHHTAAAGQKSLKKVNIVVQDIQESPFHIELSSTEFPENASPGTVVGELTALDSDKNEQHTFQLAPDQDGNHFDNSLFAIKKSPDARFHLVTSKKSTFDFERKHQFRVQIEVRDQDNLKHRQVLHLKLLDINEPPSGITLSQDEFHRNTAIGTTVGKLAVSTNDSGDTVTLSLNESELDNEHFMVTSLPDETIALRTNSDFTHTTKEHFKISVEAKDQTGLSTTKIFQLKLAPSIELKLEDLKLSENQQIGTPVANIVTDQLNPKLTLPGIHAVKTALDQSYFIKDNGELWAMGDLKYIDPDIDTPWDPTKWRKPIITLAPKMILASGVRNIAAISNDIFVVKNDGSLWKLGAQYKRPFYHPSKPIQLVDEGVIDTIIYNPPTSGQRSVIFLKEDGSVWRVRGLAENHEMLFQSKGLHSLQRSSREIYYGYRSYDDSHADEIMLNHRIRALGRSSYGIQYVRPDGSLWVLPHKRKVSGPSIPKEFFNSGVKTVSGPTILKEDGSLLKLTQLPNLQTQRSSVDPFSPAPNYPPPIDIDLKKEFKVSEIATSVERVAAGEYTYRKRMLYVKED